MRLRHRHPSHTCSRLAGVASVLSVLAFRPVPALATPVGQRPAQDRPPPSDARDSTGHSDSLSQQITGVVRNYYTDAPIYNVRVRSTGTADSAVTGRDGRYTIRLAAGSHSLQFTHPAYHPLTVVVFVGDESPPAVDVSLTPLPALLAGVHVSEVRPKPVFIVPSPEEDTVPGRRVNADGGQVWSQAAIRSAPQLDQSDLFRLLGTAPTAATQSESPSALHFGGGSADQNLVLLDGIPIENAVHAGWLASAINPAAIETMTLYADHTPARFGGRLSGVVELRTRGTTDEGGAHQASDTTPPRPADDPALSGTIGYGNVAVLAAGRDAKLGASGLLSLRHSPRELGHFWPQRNESDFLRHSGWFDGLARGGIPAAGGELSALGFQSHDAVVFNAATPPFTLNTGFEWLSSAFGGTWTRALGGLDESTLTLRAWRSNAETHGVWPVYSGNLTVLTNALGQSGVSADVHTTREHVEVHSGIAAERFRTSYVTTPYTALAQSVVSTDSTSQLSLAGTLATTSAYTDVRWRLSNQWTVAPGTRVTHWGQPDRSGWQFEPRLGVSRSLGAHGQLAAYYGRTSQQLQSLRNEEAVSDGGVGLNLLSVQNDRVPAATATTFSGTMTAVLGRTVTAVLGAYGRRLNNIVVAPHTGNAPFVSDSLASGRGFARGWYATLTRTTPRLMMEGDLRLTVTRFSAANVNYQPTFASTRFASFALGWHVDRRTDAHAFFVASGGRRAPLTLPQMLLYASDGNLAPTLQSYGSAATVDPGSQVLPRYLNVNVGVSRALLFTRSGSHGGAGVRVFGAVDNALNRANTIGISGEPGRDPNSWFIWYHPRTYRAGLDWQW